MKKRKQRKIIKRYLFFFAIKMNIFNDSNYSIPQPTNGNFTSITTDNIIIPGATSGDLLFMNGTQVTGLAIGPQNYLLQSSGAEPQWSNSLNVNTITTTDLKINGTSEADIFSVGADGYFDRIPLGPFGSILTCGLTNFDWVNYSDGYAFFKGGVLQSEAPFIIPDNSYSNIPLTNTLLFTFNTPVIQNRRYKMTITGRQNSVDQGQYLLNIGPTNYCSWVLTGGADLARVFIYNHVTASGFVQVTFYGQGTVSLNNSIVQMNFISEPFN
jgi:hypothetical protein